VQLVGEYVGKKVKITAIHKGRTIHFDAIPFDNASLRDRFVKGVCKRLPEVDMVRLEADLLKLPETIATLVLHDSCKEPDAGKVKVVLAYAPGANGRKGVVTAELEGRALHIDNASDPANAQHRAKFIKALVKKVPNIDVQDTESQFLIIAEKTGVPIPPSPPPKVAPMELDISGIVRPEQFYRLDVACLTAVTVTVAADRLSPGWVQYLRWEDGRRECRELAGTIDLANGRRLWIHPIPGDPAMNTVPGWSVAARRAWLDGATAPDPGDLFKRICERIACFIDLPSDVAAGTTATLALWVLFTYVYQAWDAVPYLFVGGTLSSGKSRVFEVLSRLVFRALVSSNVTAPALFRTLHERGGTFLFDEAERLRNSTPETTEILSMLLAGYKRGGQATRLEPAGDTFKTVTFDVYGPKALACIAGLPAALASRCIPVTMFRASPNSMKPRRRIDGDPMVWQTLRDDLHALALECGRAWMSLATREDVCPPGVYGRAYELWQPLLSLASWVEAQGAKGLLELVSRHALATLDAGKDEQVSEADETLLEILTEAVRADEWVTPGEILDRAQQRDPGTFGKPNGSGPRWQPNTVSRRLKNYGIGTPKKSNGKRYYRNVTLDQLRLVQRHYDIELQIEEPVPQLSTLTDPPDPASVSTGATIDAKQGR
jgi:hypothetical protein